MCEVALSSRVKPNSIDVVSWSWLPARPESVHITTLNIKNKYCFQYSGHNGKLVIAGHPYLIDL